MFLSIWRDGQLRTSLYDKPDDFNFHITNFPILRSKIPSSPAYGVFISQLIRYARTSPLMNVLFWGRCDFYISFSRRDTSGSVWNRLFDKVCNNYNLFARDTTSTSWPRNLDSMNFLETLQQSDRFFSSEVLDNHKSVLTSFGIQANSEELDLPYIYWIPKMHKNPYKHKFIVGSSKCLTKPLSILLTKLLTHIKQGLQKYCETGCSKSRVNQMWILKNSKELLDHLKSPNFNLITNIKSWFSTLYTTIHHQKLKSMLATIIRNSLLHKNGNRRYKYLVLGHEGPYFVKEHSDSKNKYTEEDIVKMLEFLVDNIFVVFAGKVFQQIIGIPMGTNCIPLLADIFLYSCEAKFIQSLLSAEKKR